MPRILATLSIVSLLVATAAAQCVIGTAITAIGDGDDVVFATHYPLGFSMPVAGSALGSYTHFRVCSNGWLVLTNGTSTPLGTPAGNNYGSATSLAGTAAGNAPRIVPFWKHMYVAAPGLISYDNTSFPGVSCRILFADTVEFESPDKTKTYEVTLYANGQIDCSYAAGMDVDDDEPAYCGVSRGNGASVPAASDLSAGFMSMGVGCVWQSFGAGEFDLGGKTICFTPDGLGGWNDAICCVGATHDIYGEGSYEWTAPETIYDSSVDAATAKAELEGNSVRLTKSSRGYVPTGWEPTWNPVGVTYLPPTVGSTPLPPTDDGWSLVTPSLPFPLPDGSLCPRLAVSHNGIITLRSTPNNRGDRTPTGPELAASKGAAVYSWHDFNDTEPGSGRIRVEEIGSLLCITWFNVESRAMPETSNPSTIQFQFDLATGNINLIWVLIDGNATSPFGSGTVVGFTGPGVSPDPGEISFSQGGLPQYVVHNGFPLALAAEPPPVCTQITGTNVTYTTSRMVEVAPTSGVYLGVLILSFGSIPPTDLGFVGAPGALLHIASFDIVYGMAGLSRTQQVVVPYPASTPSGLMVYAQSACLFDPAFPLPNGQNPLGLITSNAIASLVRPF